MQPGSGTRGFASVGRKVMIATLLATTALLVEGARSGSGARAQAGVQTTFNIPAGPLSRALATFGRQSGTQVSYEAAIANGKTSPGFQGTATREQVIAQLLQGSGLVYSFSDATNVLITRPRPVSATTASDGSLLLDTINVEGQGSTIGMPRRPMPGGRSQRARGSESSEMSASWTRPSASPATRPS